MGSSTPLSANRNPAVDEDSVFHVSRLNRRHDRPDRKAVLGSIGVHLVAVVLVVLTLFLKPVPQTFLVYEMNIVSPTP